MISLRIVKRAALLGATLGSFLGAGVGIDQIWNTGFTPLGSIIYGGGFGLILGALFGCIGGAAAAMVGGAFKLLENRLPARLLFASAGVVCSVPALVWVSYPTPPPTGRLIIVLGSAILGGALLAPAVAPRRTPG